ncbi:MAG: hypothetical protein ACKOX6_14340 [Bdellovibrio sp.]
MRLKRVLVFSILAGVCISSFQNCAKNDVAFEELSAQKASGTESSPPTSDGGSVGGNIPTTSANPKMEFKILSCAAKSLCVASVRLFPASPVKVTGNWNTADQAYLSGNGTIAKPNVDYIPTNGSLTFEANDSSWKELKVQSISNATIQIPFLISNCQEGGQSVDCGKFR